MGYRKINNLYKDQTVLMFKELYALEKIHGTSAHLSFKFHNDENTGIPYNTVTYFSGGEKHENFVNLFNQEDLLERANNLLFNRDFTVYGEAYGGKQQGMSETYGKELKFVAFELEIGDKFVGVQYANDICDKLAIEFVHWEIVPADVEVLDKLCIAPSVQAKRNGVENPKLPREGIVLRPLKEFLHPDGVGRIIAKHKNELFREREHAPKLKNPEDLKVIEDARLAAEEFVVPMRLEHVLDKLKASGMEISEKKMNDIIKAMVDDVYTEAKDEIVESKELRKAIGKKTAKLFIEKLKSSLLTTV